MEKNLKQKLSEVKKIVICGPESTGKSTLAKNLALHFNTNYVSEFARDFLQRKWDSSKSICTKEDLIEIVKGQIKLENSLVDSANKLFFCDTNILTTIAWSRTHFDGFCNEWIEGQSKILHYDYYLILDVNIPWIKDDLRDRPNDRKKMFLAHKKELDNLKVDYDIINGLDFKKRFAQALEYIKNKY